MIAAILLGLRTAGAFRLWYFRNCGATHYDICFSITPGSAPVTAVLIILSIGIAGGTLQSTGGIDYLVYLASKVIENIQNLLFLFHRLLSLSLFWYWYCEYCFIIRTDYCENSNESRYST